MKIHWKPTQKQTEALLSEADETLYGGARGGGKTDAGMVWMIEPVYISNPLYRGLVIRKNADDLKDWIDRARRMYAPLGAEFTGQTVDIKFPSGAIIRTGHLKDAGSYTKYQGHEYQKELIEEITKIPRESYYQKLIGSCRSTLPGLKAKVFATTNPDGDGYEWVRDRWDCTHPDKKVKEFYDQETGITKTKLFIPANVDDNPYLIDNDPGYVAYLNGIKDETLRKQWRFGDWTEPKIEGAYYAKQIEQARQEGRITAVKYDSLLRVNTWWDLGMNDSMCIWFTQHYGNQIRVIDYLEGSGEGLRYYYKELEKKGYIYSGHYFPHDIEVRELGTGTSRKEIAQQLGFNPCYTVKRVEDKQDGIETVRGMFNRFWFDEENCKIGLTRLKNYKKEFDEKHNIYKDTPVHDQSSHGADAFQTLAVGYKQYINETPSNQDFDLYNSNYD